MSEKKNKIETNKQCQISVRKGKKIDALKNAVVHGWKIHKSRPHSIINSDGYCFHFNTSNEKRKFFLKCCKRRNYGQHGTRVWHCQT